MPGGILASLNRTFMELKLDVTFTTLRTKKRLNRTFMELKPRSLTA